MDKTLEKASIPVPYAKISPTKPVNDEFTLCKIYVHGCGKNRNYSYMSEERAREALPTLSYAPVVGHLMPKYNEDGEQEGYYFGSHDYEVDDNLNFKAMTVPFGVVIDNSFDFEDVEEFGKTVRYLTCNAYLWTGRWPELKEAVYSDDVWFNQSMEVTKIQYRPLEEDSNYSEFLSWNYSALCILGKSDNPEYHSEPCFINAKIQPVKFDLATDEFSQMMGELKEQLALCFEKETNQKGGNHLNQEERDAIFANYALTPEMIDFQITEDMTAEELNEQLKAYVEAHQPAGDSGKPEDSMQGGEEPTTDPVTSSIDADGDAEDPESSAEPAGEDGGEEGAEGANEPADPTTVEPAATFGMTYKKKYEELEELCSTLNHIDYDVNGKFVKECYCWLCDFDDSHVFYSENIWTNDGHTTNQKRCAYELGADETEKAKFVGEHEEVFEKWLTAAEIKQLEDNEKQLEALMQFKDNVEKAAYDAKLKDLFDQFEDVAGTEEYAALKSEAEANAEFDLDNLETKLFAVRGKQVKIEKKAQTNGIRVGIDAEEFGSADDGYGGLVAKQRNKRSRRI